MCLSRLPPPLPRFGLKFDNEAARGLGSVTALVLLVGALGALYMLLLKGGWRYKAIFQFPHMGPQGTRDTLAGRQQGVAQEAGGCMLSRKIHATCLYGCDLKWSMPWQEIWAVDTRHHLFILSLYV